jgi:hypothetical protein
MDHNELLARYTASATEAESSWTLPVHDDDGENALNCARYYALKTVVSAIERYLRGDFGISTLQKILRDSAEYCGDGLSEQEKRKIYSQALDDVSRVA